MERVFSKVEPNILLFVINRHKDISSNRTDLCPSSEFLQVSTKRLSKGATFKPHKHLELKREINRTQEGWIFLSGRIRASFWDIDDTKIYETELTFGDCAFVFRAGHSFEVLEDNTVLYEIKQGPYYGIEKDKEFIDG